MGSSRPWYPRICNILNIKVKIFKRVFSPTEIQIHFVVKHVVVNRPCEAFMYLCAIGALARCPKSGLNVTASGNAGLHNPIWIEQIVVNVVVVKYS